MECPPLSLTPAEVARAAPLLIGSGAAALGWRRIKDTPASKGCAEAQELCQSGQILALEDARLDGALEFVATRLNEVGIIPLIAKRWGSPISIQPAICGLMATSISARRRADTSWRDGALASDADARSGSDMEDIFVDWGPD